MQTITEMDRYSLSQIVSKKIKKFIIENELKPGDKIPSERDLVNILQVSRTVIREALSSLEMIGFVHIRHGEGVFIQEPNLSPVFDQLLFQWETNNLNEAELLELRKAIELAAIAKAAQRGTEEQFRVLEALSDELQQDGHSKERMMSLNAAFHRELVELSGNTLYRQFTAIIHDFFEKAGVLICDSTLEHIVQGQKGMIRALRARDAAAAQLSLALQFDRYRIVDQHELD